MSRPLMRAISADAMLRRAGAAVARHPPPKKVPTLANYLVFGGAAVDGAPGTFPQVILTRSFLARINDVQPAAPSAVARKCSNVLQPQYSCRARRGVWKPPAPRAYRVMRDWGQHLAPQTCVIWYGKRFTAAEG